MKAFRHGVVVGVTVIAGVLVLALPAFTETPQKAKESKNLLEKAVKDLISQGKPVAESEAKNLAKLEEPSKFNLMGGPTDPRAAMLVGKWMVTAGKGAGQPEFVQWPPNIGVWVFGDDGTFRSTFGSPGLAKWSLNGDKLLFDYGDGDWENAFVQVTRDTLVVKWPSATLVFRKAG